MSKVNRLEEKDDELTLILEIGENYNNLYLEWKLASTRECNIHKHNDLYILDMLCYGTWYDDKYFHSVDEIVECLVEEWGLPKSKIARVIEILHNF